MTPWERQEDEPETAWRAFQAYRDTHGRTLQSSGLPLPDAVKLATKYQWVSRARAYDAHLDEIRLQELEETTRRASAQAASRVVEAAFMGAEVAANAIRAILSAQAEGNGTAKVLETREAIQLLKLCDVILARRFGEPTEHIKVSAADMSTDELKALLAKLG